MLVPLQITVQSHLSDALMEIDFNPEQAQLRIHFVKWLMIKFNGVLTETVDIEALFEEFLQTQIK